MRALITNDDGIESLGLAMMAEAAVEQGLDVCVAAPCWDSSGASASLTAVSQQGRVLVERVHLDLPGDAPAYGVHGAPAFIVRAAMHGAFGPPPDLVLSGINHGPNIGRAILHSGTVGAALTGGAHGRSALAMSAQLADPPRWRTAGSFAGRAIDWLLRSPQGTVLNVNVPVHLPAAAEVKVTKLSPNGSVQANVTEVRSGFVLVRFGDSQEREEGTDAAALALGYATVTALRPVVEDERFDPAVVVT